MIFSYGAPIQYMGHDGLGQTASDVKKLQEAFKAIQTKTGDAGYNPGTLDGTMRKDVVFALVYLLNKVSRSAPGISDLMGLINQIPKAGVFIDLVLKVVGTNRSAMGVAWSTMELASAGAQKSVLDFVTRNAGAFAKAVTVVGVFLGAGVAMPIFQARIGPAFPPGSVAVRDPALGKYRILVKP